METDKPSRKILNRDPNGTINKSEITYKESLAPSYEFLSCIHEKCVIHGHYFTTKKMSTNSKELVSQRL